MYVYIIVIIVSFVIKSIILPISKNARIHIVIFTNFIDFSTE